ncbi:hypothetical protein R1sor_007745 [Riccia sorocarpa]|uniref:60S ribosomal protein L18a-like protein n=1 Tax=Riccia sorocarpa TaxID=122646 RepID=A0ABD3HUT2_9MARC
MGFDPEKGEQNSSQWEQPSHYPAVNQTPAYYGTFQGQEAYSQAVPPSQPPHYASQPGSEYASSGYVYAPQPVPSHSGAISDRFAQGQPLLGGEHFLRVDPLPFCGLGFGWFLFVLGFMCIIPWYIGVFIYFCLAHDTREKAGLLACTIAGIICLLFGGTRASQSCWGVDFFKTYCKGDHRETCCIRLVVRISMFVLNVQVKRVWHYLPLNMLSSTNC